VMSLTFAAVTCASSGTPRAHRSRCGVWTPPCGDRLGSAQFFPRASRGPPGNAVIAEVVPQQRQPNLATLLVMLTRFETG
jgi:hypothetical protein